MASRLWQPGQSKHVDPFPAVPGLPAFDSMTNAEHDWIWKHHHPLAGQHVNRHNDPELAEALERHRCVGWWQARIAELRQSKFANTETAWDGEYVPPRTPESLEAAARAAGDAAVAAIASAQRVLQVTCPECGASEGERCNVEIPAGASSAHHQSRAILARST